MTELYQLLRICLRYAPAIRGDGYAWVESLDTTSWDYADLQAVSELGYILDPVAWAAAFRRAPPHLWDVVAPPRRADGVGRNVRQWMRTGPPPGLRATTVTDDRARVSRVDYRAPGPPNGPVIVSDQYVYADDGTATIVSTAYREDGTPAEQWTRRVRT